MVTLVLVESGMAAGVFSLDQVAVVSIALLVGATMFVLATAARSRSARATRMACCTMPLRSGRCRRARMRAARTPTSCIRARACSRYRRADRPHPRACRTRRLTRARPRCSTSWRAADRYRTCATLVISRETAATHAKHVYAKLDVHSPRAHRPRALARTLPCHPEQAGNSRGLSVMGGGLVWRLRRLERVGGDAGEGGGAARVDAREVAGIVVRVEAALVVAANVEALDDAAVLRSGCESAFVITPWMVTNSSPAMRAA
ncbi:MAG: hypothetical protein ACLSVD_02340 [Eggerthellaceae bacterium]